MTHDSTDLRTTESLKNLLQTEAGPWWSSLKIRWWYALGLLFLLMIGLVWLVYDESEQGHYVVDKVQLGPLVVTVTATGTLQPTTSIDVGSEQSGTLAEVLVQENDRVKKGQLLARLDLAKLQDTVHQSRAALQIAEAAVVQSRVTVDELSAQWGRMQRLAELSGGKEPTPAELDAAKASLNRALANHESTQAAVLKSKAILKTDETNLSKGIIRSPVDGVVLARKVEPGQTVVASMSTPVLFTLAQDLTAMELQVKVDEADVGSIQLHQPATFTVSAWPGRIFPASIERIGIGSTMTDNVVTYKTVLQVQNNDLALRPGMTATATIVTAERDRALLVPNAALRFVPPEVSQAASPTGFLSQLIPRAPPVAKRMPSPLGDQARVWVLVNSMPQPVLVKVGVSNGHHTEVLSGDLSSSMEVITDYQER
ncbi:MAG: hypothetical protein RLZZ397_739 [Pseudomonadota bacterium]